MDGAYRSAIIHTRTHVHTYISRLWFSFMLVVCVLAASLYGALLVVCVLVASLYGALTPSAGTLLKVRKCIRVHASIIN